MESASEDAIDPEQDRLLNKLAYMGKALFDSYENEKRPRCLKNTRVKILKEIKIWACSKSQHCIYWLQGMLGTGKSTIALTVAQQLRHLSLPVVSYFFKRGAGDLAYGNRLIPTIVHQMAYQSRLFRTHITAVIMKEPYLGQTAGLSEQYERLLIKPLQILRSDKSKIRPFIVLIDALDECESEDDIRTFLQLLANTEDLSFLGLRILITSRPEIPIRLDFKAIPNIFVRSLALQDTPRSVVDRDIKRFIKHQLIQLQRERRLSTDWPKAKEIQMLVDKAAGLFVFAATACQYIGGSPQANPQDRLQQVCSIATQNQLMTEELDQMYIIVIKSSLQGKLSKEEKEHHNRQFRKLVGAVILLHDPLPIPELYKLICDSKIKSPIAIHHILDPLQAVLKIPSTNKETVQLLHLSFRDFLIDHTRCTDPYFCINERQTHNDLISSCLHLLSLSVPQNLSQSLYENRQDISELSEALTPAVQYACQNWIKHVQSAHMELCDNGPVHDFLKKGFLSWAQSMSLLKDFSGALEGIRDLTALVNVSLSSYLSEL